MTENKMIKIPFQDDTLLAIQHEGKHYVSIRRVCNAIGMTYSCQLNKLKQNPNANVLGLDTLDEAGRTIKMAFVDWESVPKWLGDIRINQVLPEIRTKLVKYQKEVKDVLAAHFLGVQPKVHVPEVLPTIQHKQEVDLFDDEGDADLVILAKLYKARKEILAVQRQQEAQWAALKATELLALEADHTANQAIQVAQVADTKAEAAHKAITNASGWFSVMAYSKLVNLDVPLAQLAALGRKATARCDNQGVTVQKVDDPRFGRIGTYPKNVLNGLLPEFVSRSSTPQAVRQPIA